jgi:hypothetical protein
MIGLLRSALFIAAAAALLLPSAGARADQIDGHWYHADGRNLSIEGSMIITPGGNEIVRTTAATVSFSPCPPINRTPAPGLRCTN